MKLRVVQTKEVEIKFLKVSATVRYWEDSSINGEPDEEGTLTPFRKDTEWCPVIDIEEGIVVDWPKGMEASFHFKVCDAGSYYLLDAEMNEHASIDNNYVPDGLCHGDTGFGDYIIFSVNGDGSIVDYSNKVNPEDWTEEEE